MRSRRAAVLGGAHLAALAMAAVVGVPGTARAQSGSTWEGNAPVGDAPPADGEAVPQRVDREDPKRHKVKPPRPTPAAAGDDEARARSFAPALPVSSTRPARKATRPKPVIDAQVVEPPPEGEMEPDRPSPDRPPRDAHLDSAPEREELRADEEAQDTARGNKKRKQAAPKPNGVEEMVRRSQGDLDFFELIDEMLDEITYQIGKQDPGALSPLAVRLVRLSANLRPEFAQTLESRLIARLSRGTDVRMVVCVECTAMRSRVEDGQWLVALGAVRQEDLRRIAAQTGVRAFMDLGFSYNAETHMIWLDATVFRASDGGVLWSDAYRSDATTAALLRTGKRIQSRQEKLDEIDNKLRMRPNFGYALMPGIAQLGYKGPTGNITGAQITLRFHERFGEMQNQLFGISGGILYGRSTTIPIVTTMLGAYYSRNLSEPNLNAPELWAYGELGGLLTGILGLSGNQGNSFYVESGLDLHLKWRLSIVGGLQYVFPSRFADYDLGGLGFRTRLAFNW